MVREVRAQGTIEEILDGENLRHLPLTGAEMHRRDVYAPNVSPEALREVHDSALKKLTGATPAGSGRSRSRAVSRLLDYGGLPVDMLMMVLGPSVQNRHGPMFDEGHHFSRLVQQGGI